MASPDPEIEFNFRDTDDGAIHTENDTTNNSLLHNTPLLHGDHNVQQTVSFSPRFRSAPANHLPHIKPDTYDGTGLFDQYMSHFEDCAELADWDERTRVLVLASGLRGSARGFYMSLPDSDRRRFPTLVARLAARFGGSKHSSLWLGKLENRRRGKSESIASLADDLRQLCQKAYIEFDHASQERLALNQLYKLISTEMRCRCLDQNCQTLNDAVAVIERYESILGTPVIRACENVANTQQHTPDLSQTLQRIEARLDRIESVNTRKSNPQAQNARLCYGCNSPDHMWSSCPRNRNAQRTQGNNNTRRYDNTRESYNHSKQHMPTFNNQPHNMTPANTTRVQEN